MYLNGTELKGKEVEVAENTDGRLELFVIGLDNKVWQTWQTVPNGLLGWSNPTDFGMKATEIEASRNKDGRLETFAIDTDGQVQQKWQRNVNGNWSNWRNFGLDTKAVEMDVVQNQDGRLEVFAIGSDGAIKQKWQNVPNGGTDWSNWNSFRLQNGSKAVDIEVARNADGRLEAFAIGSDNQVWQRWQQKVNSKWAAWTPFGIKASEVDIVQNKDGRLEIFAIRTDGEVFQRWQQKPNGVTGWSNWNQFGLNAVEIEAARNADGRPELFAIRNDNQVFQKWQQQVNSSWNAWDDRGLQAISEEQNSQPIQGDRLTQLAQKPGTLSIDEIQEYRQLVIQKPESERTAWYHLLQPKTPFFNQLNNTSYYKDNKGFVERWNMCGVTSLAGALTYLGIKNPLPTMQFEDALEKIRRQYNLPAKLSSGAETWEALIAFGKHFNVDPKYVDGALNDARINSIKAALDRGASVVLGSNVNGLGHIVRIQGYDDTGFFIDDPYGDATQGSKNSKKGIPYDYKVINNRKDDGEGQIGNNNKWSWAYTKNAAKRYLVLG